MNTREIVNLVKSSLFKLEKYAPQIASRAWGVVENPLAEIQGFKLTKLSEKMAEVTARVSVASMAQMLMASELAVKNLWARHLGAQDKLIMTDCHCELTAEKPVHHFVARTELLENDRERALRLSRQDQNSDLEMLVLVFDLSEKLVCRVQLKMKIKNYSNLLLGEGVSP
jgi:hypothetical protein